MKSRTFLLLAFASLFAGGAHADPLKIREEPKAPRNGADQPFEFSCLTEIPTTTFVVWTEGEEVLARVIHHNGSQYAPAIVGTYTPNDLPTLAKRAAAVRKMKNDTTFRWPKAKCQHLGEMGLYCTGATGTAEGEEGAKLKPWALYTSTVVEEGVAGKLESMNVSVIFDVDQDRDQSVEMKYPKGSCVPRKIF